MIWNTIWKHIFGILKHEMSNKHSIFNGLFFTDGFPFTNSSMSHHYSYLLTMYRISIPVVYSWLLDGYGIEDKKWEKERCSGSGISLSAALNINNKTIYFFLNSSNYRYDSSPKGNNYNSKTVKPYRRR